MAKGKQVPKKNVVKAPVKKVEEVKKVAEVKKVEEVKKEIPKVEVPVVLEKPATEKKEVKTVRVRVLKDYEDVAIFSKRYSGKAGTEANLPKTVARILRQDGSVI